MQEDLLSCIAVRFDFCSSCIVASLVTILYLEHHPMQDPYTDIPWFPQLFRTVHDANIFYTLVVHVFTGPFRTGLILNIKSVLQGYPVNLSSQQYRGQRCLAVDSVIMGLNYAYSHLRRETETRQKGNNEQQTVVDPYKTIFLAQTILKWQNSLVLPTKIERGPDQPRNCKKISFQWIEPSVTASSWSSTNTECTCRRSNQNKWKVRQLWRLYWCC